MPALLADRGFPTDDKSGQYSVHHAGLFDLATGRCFWHERRMSRQSPRSGGVFLPIGIFAGLLMGAVAGEPTAGLLMGTAGGGIAATWFWLKDRKTAVKRRKH